jgi:hypothetical protein
MFRTVLPNIKTLFSSEGRSREPVHFDWRLIRRKRWPFLLLPATTPDVQVGLKLYSAQRRRAKIWRALLPLLFKTPAAALYKRVHFEADAGAEIMQFLAQQSGVPAERIQVSAIKFGGVAQLSRIALLLCDETRRPVSVVKVGLNSAGHEATNREADLLEKLPHGALGCIRMTGRLKTPALSAFATAYFPGDSPGNDAGMEQLFHAWLNPGPSVPLASLNTWRDLAAEAVRADSGTWQVLSAALAEKTVRTTLYHGDFAPWNIRAVNVQNLQVFDWERGRLQGIPGWDWFHFVVQTAILARRHSVERVAAEVEQLLHSDRFKKYAAEAGISDFVQPLLLAYLLHQKWVIKPQEGGERTAELFDLLSARWQMAPQPAGVHAVAPAESHCPGLWADALLQLKSAAIQLSNLFWKPSLTARVQPSLHAQFLRHWPVVLLAGLMLSGVAAGHYLSSAHLLFVPFYLIPCALLTWIIDRRWGTLAAIAAAVAGPLVAYAKDPGSHKLDVMVWNMVMRLLTLQICVLFLGQISRHKNRFERQAALEYRPGKFTENWAVVLASGLLFMIVAKLDLITDPHMSFLPLYLLPCMILTLRLNLGWGIAIALVGATAVSLMQYYTGPYHEVAKVFGWNLGMRLVIFLFVAMLLDRIRKENPGLFSRNHNGYPTPPSRV